MTSPRPLRKASPGPQLTVRVVARRVLVYDGGADPASDRPAHVRAGSTLTRFGNRLVVAQDDALWLAELGPDDTVGAIALPRGAGGVRVFDDGRGNKPDKPDFEAAAVIETTARSCLVIFGSGSTRRRERVVVLEPPAAPRLVDVHALYTNLRATADFAGSELNVEGAVGIGGRVLLLARGNGAADAGRSASDATCELDAAALLSYLDDPVTQLPPLVEAVQGYDLGNVDGVRLTFTDAARDGDRVVYLAVAEASPDAVRDGPVSGVAFGILGEDPRYSLILAEDGTPLRQKLEGLAAGPRPGSWYAVADVDDPDRPAELLELEVLGAL